MNSVSSLSIEVLDLFTDRTSLFVSSRIGRRKSKKQVCLCSFENKMRSDGCNEIQNVGLLGNRPRVEVFSRPFSLRKVDISETFADSAYFVNQSFVGVSNSNYGAVSSGFRRARHFRKTDPAFSVDYRGQPNCVAFADVKLFDDVRKRFGDSAEPPILVMLSTQAVSFNVFSLAVAN